jgi:hypothetical protein
LPPLPSDFYAIGKPTLSAILMAKWSQPCEIRQLRANHTGVLELIGIIFGIVGLLTVLVRKSLGLDRDEPNK